MPRERSTGGRGWKRCSPISRPPPRTPRRWRTRSSRMSRASRRARSPRTISRFWCFAGMAPGRRALPDDDLDPAIPRLGDLVRGGDEQLALAAPAGLDALSRDAELDEAGANAVRALQGQTVVVLLGAHRVGVADDDDFRRRTARDVLQHVVNRHLRL